MSYENGSDVGGLVRSVNKSYEYRAEGMTNVGFRRPAGVVGSQGWSLRVGADGAAFGRSAGPMLSRCGAGGADFCLRGGWRNGRAAVGSHGSDGSPVETIALGSQRRSAMVGEGEHRQTHVEPYG